MKVFIASKNVHKIDEMKKIFMDDDIQIIDFRNLNVSDEEPIEDGDTLLENAKIKAKFWCDRLKLPVIADDTGLFVPALNGEPGIYSARYAGEECSYDDNVNKLLKELSSSKERSAYFETCSIFLRPSGEEIVGIGRLNGKIISEKRGSNGFGYDPVFYIDEYKKTLAELSDEQKNSISHRYLSLMDLRNKMKKVNGNN